MLKKLVQSILFILGLTFTLVLIMEGCNKKKTPEPVQTEPCVKQSEIFTGKYMTVGTVIKDTITITFNTLNCPDKNSDNYNIKNLYKAVADYSSTNMQDKDYTLISNEQLKYCKSGEYSINFGFGTNLDDLSLSCSAPSYINMLFKRVN